MDFYEEKHRQKLAPLLLEDLKLDISIKESGEIQFTSEGQGAVSQEILERAIAASDYRRQLAHEIQKRQARESNLILAMMGMLLFFLLTSVSFVIYRSFNASQVIRGNSSILESGITRNG